MAIMYLSLCIASEVEVKNRQYEELKNSYDDLIYTLNQLAIEKFKHEADAIKYFETLQALLEDMDNNNFSKYSTIIREAIK